MRLRLEKVVITHTENNNNKKVFNNSCWGTAQHRVFGLFSWRDGKNIHTFF